MGASADRVRNISLVRKIRLEDVCSVGFDAVEEVIVGWVEQFGDGRHVIAAVAEPFFSRRSSVSSLAVGSRTHPGQSWRRVWMRETRRLSLGMSRSDVVGVPCERSTCIAYSKLLHDDSSIVTWSFNLALTLTQVSIQLSVRFHTAAEAKSPVYDCLVLYDDARMETSL